MMALVLTRGALKGPGSAHKWALSQVRARSEVGEAEPATASIVVVFTGLPSKSGAAPTLAMTPTLPHATINTKLTEVAILISQRRISLAVVYPDHVDVNLWPTQGLLPENQVLG
jgi:hypothetical protein